MKKLLIEGPVGHMWHPFDMDSVKNGKDLLDVFENDVVEYVNKFSPSIKIDGINGPIRLVTNRAGEKEFAIDRLSAAPIDREGVTADRLRERFEKAILILIETGDEIKLPLHKLAAFIDLSEIEEGKTLEIIHRKKKHRVRVKEITSGHGFVNDGSVALRVLNHAYQQRRDEMESILDVLGMLDNPNICLNNDIVHESSKGGGMVNAVPYEEDFIAFHGLNEIYSEEGKKSRKTREVRMSGNQKKALSELVALCNEVNPVEGFRVLSPFDTVALKGEVDIDYSPVLTTPITLHMDEEHAVSKTLQGWLEDPKITKPSYDEKYLFADGRKRSYFSKDVYIHLIPDEGERVHSVAQILADDYQVTEDDFYKFASGAIFYHATRLLGRVVLKTLVNKSKVGSEDLSRHEGIVMRSEKIFGVDKPIKITGDFIRSGMAGSISKVIKEIADNVQPEVAAPETGEQPDNPHSADEGGKRLAITPGSFKPPHMGHLRMAEELSRQAEKVLIFVSAPEGSKRLLPISGAEITYEKAIELWRILLRQASPNIELVESDKPHPSPIQALDQMLKPIAEREYYKDVDVNPDEYSKYILGMSEKEKDDPTSVARFSQYEDNPKVLTKFVPAFDHPEEYAAEIQKIIASNQALIAQIDSDVAARAMKLADSLISQRARKKLPANASLQDYIGLLSKKNAKIVAKLLKASPKLLDKQAYSATDLRILFDFREVYQLPVDNLLKDFIGDNVDDFMKVIYTNESVNESIMSIESLVRQVLETSVMGGAVGGVEGYAGGSRAEDEDEDEDEDKPVEEALAPYHELPHGAGGMRSKTVIHIGSSRHRPTGATSDKGYKKYVASKYKFDLTNPNIERRPYFSPCDTVEDLVEMLYRTLTS